MKKETNWMDIPDSSARLEQLKADSKQGDSVASAKLSLMYACGMNVEADKDLESMYSGLAQPDHLSDCYLTHAIEGNASAYYQLYGFHSKGLGRELQPAIALSYLEKAAEYGSLEAMLYLGNSSIDGGGVIPKNPQAAEKWLLKAAEKKCFQSYANLYSLYTYEIVDPDKALHWINQGAEAGGQYELSTMWFKYSRGEGVTKDMAMALKYYCLYLCQYKDLTDRKQQKFEKFLKQLTAEEVRLGVSMAKEWLSSHDASLADSVFKGVQCDFEHIVGKYL